MTKKGKLLASSITAFAVLATVGAGYIQRSTDAIEVQHIELGIKSEMVSACGNLTIYHSETKDVTDEVTVECLTNSGVYRVTEHNPHADLIEDSVNLPSYYKGLEIMSNIRTAKLHIDADDKVLMSFEVASNQAKIRNMINDGTFGENIEPLLARMNLSARTVNL
ncbi:hypothetical protein LMH73_011680 [Vibrio splendidus]|nr:hypothetical protein [Vibrio splendidus]MCC4883044.1 hypothetical protein [Vibrio splendidus]